MYKINIFQVSNGTWVYSFSMRSYGQLEDAKRVLYDITFPFVLAIKAIITRHEKYGYIYGPEFCENCRKCSTEDDVTISFCKYCTQLLCVGCLEEYACQCNLSDKPLHNQIKEQEESFINNGIWRIGCSEKNCIFKTYLNNKIDKSKSIDNCFTSLMSDVLQVSDYLSSPKSLPESPCESLIPNSLYDESYYISDIESIESEKIFNHRLAIIHPEDLTTPNSSKIKFYDEDIGSSDSTEDLNITSSTEKAKILAKRNNIYDLTRNEDSDSEEVEGEKIVYKPRKNFYNKNK